MKISIHWAALYLSLIHISFYVYEQVNNILDTIDKLGLGAEVAGQIFGGNAKELLGK